MDLFGERWAMPVMRELMLGPRRFGDLKASLNGISANVLTQRLEGLEAAGVLRRRKLPPPASVQVYELTQWGYQAAPIFQAMGRWAVRSPFHDKSKPFSPVSLMLSLRTMFDPASAADLSFRIGFRMGEETYFWSLADGRIDIGRGPIDGADFVFTGSPPAIASFVYGGRSIDEAVAAGDLAFSGDRELAELFPSFFPMPEPADASQA
jgi:DNA-binding HxlR family transcriptional regulator